MKKVLFIATVVKTHINVFHLPYIKMFKDNGYVTVVAAKNDYQERKGIPYIPNCDKYVDVPFERNPFSPRNVKAYKMLKKMIESEAFDMVQCNTPVGGVLGRLAARKARKNGTRVIYIAHGFHFFKGSPALSWLVFYPVEKFLSYMTDVLITINKEDYNCALRHFKAKKTVWINGIGIDIDKIAGCSADRYGLRHKLGIKDSDILLISVGELRKLKNHELIIRAMSKLGDASIHYAIAGSGQTRDELENLAAQLGLERNVHLLGFCDNVGEILKASDIFCFPSHREGLPVALMEAMAAGLPAVASDVRGNTDLIVPGKGGFLYSPDDAEGFAEGIRRLAQDRELRGSMGEYNKESIKAYDIKMIKEKLSNIYFASE